MTLQSLLLAVCVWCGATASASATNHMSEECFASLSQLRQVHKTEHAYRHKTPNGMCWHIGKKNHSGTFTEVKPKPSKPRWTAYIIPNWSTAKPIEFKTLIDIPEVISILRNEEQSGYKKLIWEGT